MAYTGMWLANAKYRPGPTALHVVDPAHADVTTGPDSYQALTYAAPPSDPVGALSLYPGMEYVVTTGGLVLDQTPEDHQDGSVKGVYPDDGVTGGRVMQAAASAAAHEEDYGASRARIYEQPPMQFSSETYASQRFEMPLGTATNDVALQRGLNGLAENNPDGIRAGWDFVPYVDRKFYIGTRYHDQHVAEVNSAAIIRDQPAPAGPYGSPFNLLARIVNRRPVVPMIRRDPPPIDAPVVDDGTTGLYAASNDWVVS
jgi:hypothetical protein